MGQLGTGVKSQRVYKALIVEHKMLHYLLIYHKICLNRTEKVGLAKDWWDMSQETAWYRGEKPEGLQIGEPFLILM